MSDRGPDPAVRPIVAGITDSPLSLAAAATAARLARARGLPLRLVHAVADEPGAADVPAPRGDRESVRAAARAALARVAATSGLPEDQVTAVVRDGPADLVLVHEARAAALLVVGPGRPDGSADTVTGILVRRSPCPVLVDRPAARSGTIVVGVHGGPGTAALLAATAAEAARRGSSLLVLHGWSRATPLGRPALSQAAVDDAEAALCRGYLEPLRAEFPELPVEVRVEHGDPEEYLVQAAADAELVVVGRRPQADRTCTAGVVAQAAATPVLVVPLEDSGGTRVPSRDRPGARRATSPSAP